MSLIPVQVLDIWNSVNLITFSGTYIVQMYVYYTCVGPGFQKDIAGGFGSWIHNWYTSIEGE